MTTKRKAALVFLLVIVIFSLASMACDDTDGSKVTVKNTIDSILALGHNLLGQAKTGVDALVNDTVKTLTPNFAQ